MNGERSGFWRWSSWTLEIKVWKIVAAAATLAVLVFWFRVVHQNDEILALVRSDLVTDADGRRTWVGAFVNTSDTPLRDVAVTVDFLDGSNRSVARTEANAAELPFGAKLGLQAELPAEAARLRIYSVQWRRGGSAALMGPFRDPWEFGYLMADPANSPR